MPLNVQVLRKGKTVILKDGWDEVSLNAFLTAAVKEGDPDFLLDSGRRIGDIEDGVLVNIAWSGVYYLNTKCPLWKEGEMTLKETHAFGPWGSGENTRDRIEFRAGDVLKMWRD